MTYRLLLENKYKQVTKYVNLSEEELGSLISNIEEKDIYLISKKCEKMNDNIILFVKDCNIDPDICIGNYECMPLLYGDNPLTLFDYNIIRKFNSQD